MCREARARNKLSLLMRLSSTRVPDVKNSKEKCSKCNLNTDHHSGEAKHQNSRYERVVQVAKIYSDPRPHGITKSRQAKDEKHPTELENALRVCPSQHVFRDRWARQKATFYCKIP